ncbi:N-acetylmuramoyl-L-alanine amidase [Nonomuraea sp. NPDC049400]|uniref:peptidoglycan recognition protein family protein n=1 Tax=Nonomuraea sp. NPDC049400 TaxID=3364352 RepID=UPI00378927AA
MQLVKRSAFGWGASGASYAHPTRGMVIHYDGSKQGLAGKEHGACVDYWRRTRKFHMGSSRGWADIGYSFGACPHGYVFEGRGLDRIQAAQPTGNATYYSVTLMSGPGEAPTEAQINAVRELRAWLMDKGVGPLVKGHRDFYSTDCPGDALYRLVKNGTFAQPPTGAAPADLTSWTENIVKDLPVLGVGDDSYDVKTLRAALFARGGLNEKVYGGAAGLRSWLESTKFDAALSEDVKAFQRRMKLDDDGIVGKLTWPPLLRVQ